MDVINISGREFDVNIIKDVIRRIIASDNFYDCSDDILYNMAYNNNVNFDTLRDKGIKELKNLKSDIIELKDENYNLNNSLDKMTDKNDILKEKIYELEDEMDEIINVLIGE